VTGENFWYIEYIFEVYVVHFDWYACGHRSQMSSGEKICRSIREKLIFCTIFYSKLATMTTNVFGKTLCDL
jgi:hypothetical protein